MTDWQDWVSEWVTWLIIMRTWRTYKHIYNRKHVQQQSMGKRTFSYNLNLSIWASGIFFFQRGIYIFISLYFHPTTHTFISRCAATSPEYELWCAYCLSEVIRGHHYLLRPELETALPAPLPWYLLAPPGSGRTHKRAEPSPPPSPAFGRPQPFSVFVHPVEQASIKILLVWSVTRLSTTDTKTLHFVGFLSCFRSRNINVLNTTRSEL